MDFKEDPTITLYSYVAFLIKKMIIKLRKKFIKI